MATATPKANKSAKELEEVLKQSQETEIELSEVKRSIENTRDKMKENSIAEDTNAITDNNLALQLRKELMYYDSIKNSLEEELETLAKKEKILNKSIEKELGDTGNKTPGKKASTFSKLKTARDLSTTLRTAGMVGAPALAVPILILVVCAVIGLAGLFAYYVINNQTLEKSASLFVMCGGNITADCYFKAGQSSSNQTLNVGELTQVSSEGSDSICGGIANPCPTVP